MSTTNTPMASTRRRAIPNIVAKYNNNLKKNTNESTEQVDLRSFVELVHLNETMLKMISNDIM